jgi:CTP synthase
LKVEQGPQNTVSIHVTLVPWIAAAGELKTKPTQHSVKELLGLGIQPEMLICRVDRPLDKEVKRKIAHFTNVGEKCVVSAVDVEYIYELPLKLHEEGIDTVLVEQLNIWSRQPDLSAWRRVVDGMKRPGKGRVAIALVGKYVHLRDAYKSLHEALVHGGLANDVRVELHYVDSEEITPQNADEKLGSYDAILVPGGFGDRGTEGKIQAIRYARETGVPFFGICLGMQLAVIEFARHVCGVAGATSEEFVPDAEELVIHLMPDQLKVKQKGGTMRLGAYPCRLAAGSLAEQIYGASEVSERHRHRFEVNNKYRDLLAQHGLGLTGLSPDGRLVELAELPGHPYFLGCQFHPEFKSRPHAAHPLFVRFVAAGVDRAKQRGRLRLSDAPPAMVH